MAQGDLGSSFRGTMDRFGNVGNSFPVSSIVWRSAPNSLLAFMLAVGAAFLVGSRLGRVSAWRPRGWLPFTWAGTSLLWFMVLTVLVALAAIPLLGRLWAVLT